LLGRGADDAGEFGLAPKQMAKVDDVQAKKGALLRRDDGGVARIAGEQREFAEEIPRPETDRVWPQTDFNFASGDKVVCPACSIAWGWKSPVQPDGGEGLAKHKGVIARWRLKAVWSKTAA
jgi:hypothetical protein